ncbi:ATP-binding domain-containing protein, partial [bacterium]|nr:ATP-binding domain-containing protein [bacterium]
TSLLNTSLRDLLREDRVSKDDIVVLSASNRAESIIDSPLMPNDFEFEKLVERASVQKGKIGFTTAGLFKGLERKIVIVTDVDSLDQGADLRRLYVAMTRANTLLVVLMSSNLKESFEKRWFEFERNLG